MNRPGSIRLCPGQSPTDVDGSLSTVMKAHWVSITTFIHMAGRNRVDDSKYPPRYMYSLTEKGNKIAQNLKEIEEILKG